MRYKLSILIPTYNREINLIHNLKILSLYIRNNKLKNKIVILISDNCSTDNTVKNIHKFISQNIDININLYIQEKNKGLENNVLFLLNIAKSKYIMYLGDDDYLEENYLAEVINILDRYKNIRCIIPSTRTILPNGEIRNSGRDLKLKSQLYNPSFKSCMHNSWRGHQLSGLTFLRDSLFYEYKKRKIKNIYPFIFFVSYSALKGKLYHFTKYPVLVTEIEQKYKDWGYKSDGLISDIFDNYKKLFPHKIINRFLLEFFILNKQKWRYLMYLHNKKKFIKAIISIIKSNNSSVLTKVNFPIYLGILFSIKIFKKMRIIFYDKY